MSVVGSVSVRVVPSFSGVHRQITQQMTGAASQAASQAGAAAGQQMSRAMSTSLNLQSVGRKLSSVGDSIAGVGSKLTRSITLPVAGATAAVGGLTAALGWKRLVSLDTAQGQLRGLGYEAEEVERITGQVSTALEGGMMTLGEGAGVAAGALAAGVKEGKELERYIGLVDSASVGMNASAAETAGIFNRIQGSGKLMRNELDMIEFRMPGFQNAVADSLGVTVDEMFNMVSAGEVTSDQFLDVMENFAGGMAEEHAKTWEGMVQNTLAYVGILGENILSGVFQMSKDELGLFILELKEAGDSEWAKQLGSTIRDVFSGVVDAIKSAVSWWRDLDTEQQKAIGAWAGAAVAAGPLLVALGKIVGIVGTAVTGVGKLVGALGGGSGLAKALRVVTGPIGWVVAGLVTMWTASEDFREGVTNLAITVWEAFQDIWEAIEPLVSLVGDLLLDALSAAGDVIGWVADVLADGLGWTVENIVIPVIEFLVDVITGLIDWFSDLGDESSEQGEVLAGAWERIGDAASWVWDNVLSPVFGYISDAWADLVETFSDLWETHLQPAFEAIGDAATEMWETHLQPAWEGLKDALQTLWDDYGWILEEVALLLLGLAAAPIILALGSLVVALYAIAAALRVVAEVSEIVVMAMTGDWQGLGQKFAEYGSWISGTLGLVRTGFERTRDGVARATGVMAARFAGMATTLRDQTVGSIGGTVAIFMGRVGGMRDDFFRRMGEMTRRFQELASNFAGTVAGSITQTFLNFRSRVGELRDNFSSRMANIRSRFGSLAGALRDTWASRIRPVFSEFGSFLRNNLVGRVSEAVGRIEEIWSRIRSAFARPINAVISGVFNNGLVRAFNNIARFVPGVSEIDRIPTIGAYAKGGRVSEDWYIAGEEGPELIHRGRESHRVYTADETAKALSATGNEDVPEDVARKAAGSRPSEALLPMGPAGAAGSAIGGIVERVRDVVDWARGGLESAAKKFLSPIFSEAAGIADQGYMGSLGLGVARKLRDDIFSWASKDDDEFSAALSGDGAGLFDGPTGAWKRPSRGPVTSWYGPRWGSIHSGIDIAGGGPTFAAYNGVVQGVGWNILPGRTGVGILLSHGGGLQTYYGHNPVGGPRVSVGQPVSAGQHIGYQGATGNVTGTHLHWELLRGGRAQNVNSMFRDKGGLIYPGMNQVLNETGGAEYVFNQRQFDNLNRLAEGGGGRSAAIEQLTINGVVPSEMERGLQRAVFRELKRQGVPVAVS